MTVGGLSALGVGGGGGCNAAQNCKQHLDHWSCYNNNFCLDFKVFIHLADFTVSKDAINRLRGGIFSHSAYVYLTNLRSCHLRLTLGRAPQNTGG